MCFLINDVDRIGMNNNDDKAIFVLKKVVADCEPPCKMMERCKIDNIWYLLESKGLNE